MDGKVEAKNETIFHNGKNDIVSQHEHHHLSTNCDDESSKAPTYNADGMARRLSFLAKDERGGAGAAWAVASLILPLLCSPLVLGEGRAGRPRPAARRGEGAVRQRG